MRHLLRTVILNDIFTFSRSKNPIIYNSSLSIHCSINRRANISLLHINAWYPVASEGDLNKGHGHYLRIYDMLF